MRLSTKNGALVLSGNDWCQVSVESGGQRFHLGADSRAVVVQRLKDALSTNVLRTVDSGPIQGREVAWVASFSERHGSLYASDKGKDRHLFAQDGEGNVIAELVLGYSDRVEWLRLLDSESR